MAERFRTIRVYSRGIAATGAKGGLLHVLFFIGHGTRRVHLADCTTNPTGAFEP